MLRKTKRQIRSRARSIREDSWPAGQYPLHNDVASRSSKNQTLSPPPLSASIRKTKIRARLDATDLQPGRRRWLTSSEKFPGKWQKESAPHRSRPPVAKSSPPSASCAAV